MGEGHLFICILNVFIEMIGLLRKMRCDEDKENKK